MLSNYTSTLLLFRAGLASGSSKSITQQKMGLVIQLLGLLPSSSHSLLGTVKR